MPRTMDWRSPNAADALKELDRSGLAWEFLRRNPEYREVRGQTIRLVKDAIGMMRGGYRKLLRGD